MFSIGGLLYLLIYFQNIFVVIIGENTECVIETIEKKVDDEQPMAQVAQ